MQMAELVWIVAGLVLIISEFFFSGFIIVFFGTSALVTGIAMWLGMPGGHGISFVLFSILTIVQIVFLRRRFTKIFMGNMASVGENDADEDFLGKTATVVSDFGKDTGADGKCYGRVDFRGTQWSACCPEPVNPGQRVKIERREGATLFVRPD
jgi:membrane protein implicated in regulation of membrane protease activity